MNAELFEHIKSFEVNSHGQRAMWGRKLIETPGEGKEGGNGGVAGTEAMLGR